MKAVFFSAILILSIFIFPIQDSFGHTLIASDCQNLGLVLDSDFNVCVESLETTCMISLHGDSIGGGFANIGTDQFGNQCREVHPSDPSLPDPFAPEPFDFFKFFSGISSEGQMIVVGFFVGVGIVIGLIIFFIARRLRRK